MFGNKNSVPVKNTPWGYDPGINEAPTTPSIPVIPAPAGGSTHDRFAPFIEEYAGYGSSSRQGMYLGESDGRTGDEETTQTPIVGKGPSRQAVEDIEFLERNGVDVAEVPTKLIPAVLPPRSQNQSPAAQPDEFRTNAAYGPDSYNRR